MTDKYPSCEERIDDRLGNALEDIRVTTLYNHECFNCGHEWTTEDDHEYECPECKSDDIDTHDPDDARDRYMKGVLEITPLHIVYRVGLSWGGPADGFLLYVDPLDKTIEYVVYYYSDWFDYAERRLSENEAELVKDMFESYIQLE